MSLRQRQVSRALFSLLKWTGVWLAILACSLVALMKLLEPFFDFMETGE